MIEISTLEKAMREYQEYKRIREEAEKAMQALQAELIAAMDDAAEITAGPFRATLSTRTRSGIDTAALKKARPEIAAEFSKETTYTVFCVK